MSLAGLKIALVGPIPPPSGGMANQTRQLQELLVGDGAIVTMVAVNAPYWPIWAGQLPILRAVMRMVPYLAKLWRAAGQADVFHIMANSGWSWHLFATPAIWIASLRGVAVVVNYRGGEAQLFLQRSAKLVRFSIRQAKALVVPSGYLSGVFSAFGMRAEIVPNIIDLSRFRPRSSVRSGTVHLLVARNLEPLYDNETAICAFQLVRASGPGFANAQLTIAGSGPSEPLLRQFVEAQGLTAVVHFAGRLERDAMAQMYRSADLLLNPSLADNMPNSLLEAWASGVPIVSTNVGGIPFLVNDGFNATLVAPADPQAMAKACCDILNDDSVWQARSLAGQKEAQRYTWNQVKPVLASVYHLAMVGPRPAGN